MSRATARGVVLGVLLLGGVVACDKPAPPPSNDTAVVRPSPPGVADSVRMQLETPWDSAAGPVFFVIGPNATTAAVVFPNVASDADVDATKLDTAPFRDGVVDLIGNGRVVSGATVRAIVPLDAPEECSGWPLVQLSGLGVDTAARTWSVGFLQGRVTTIAYDSITALTSADSSRLAIDIARLASSVPGDTVAELRGLPYQVRRAYRFPISSGIDGLVAEVWRTLNQEANPKQEHLLLIAERDTLSRGRYDIAYTERAAGGEESLESSEVLAIGRFAPAKDVSVLLARYVGDGVVYALLERTGMRRWRLRWSSPYTGC